MPHHSSDRISTALTELADRLEARARLDFGDMDINPDAGKTGEVLSVIVEELRAIAKRYA